MKSCMSRVPNPGQTKGLGIETSHPTQEAPEVDPAAAPPGDGPARALASGIVAHHVRGNVTGIAPRQAAVVKWVHPRVAPVLGYFEIP